ncbi:MAG: bifunctional folylpolyglutamate synthase/dihydrofolate synthase [Oscillatoriales cyanobacterium CG2_30_44_21]|nr:MAG: bifunctional folylpolyglutamate synthase/dihydrofolate synthase [Oscillatoriales cyanobacterium CG2_30_44_21]
MSPKLANQSSAQYLASFDKFGIHLGLERIKQLLDALGNPHQQIPVIHIAGTNGKGSVCAFLLSILKAAGYRVGRYTSPHLRDWRERLSINGEWISEQDLLLTLDQVNVAIDSEQSPTQFEVITAAMWLYFAQQNVDIAVIETGLGGRLDATNVCDRPLVCAITSIGLDHCQQLGNTLGAIAFEKAGIIKPECPVIIAENAPEAIAVLQSVAAQRNAPITLVSAAQSINLETASWQGFNYPLPLLGKHQLINSAIAIAVIQSLRDRGWLISEAAMRDGMAATQWDGRLQWMDFNLNGKSCRILIDGAHNVAAAAYLRQFVDETFPDQRKRWIIGILNTKDQAGILKTLLANEDLCYPVPIDNAAATSSLELSEIAAQYLHNQPKIYPNLSLALEDAFGDLQFDQVYRNELQDVVILCGSLYLVSDFLLLNALNIAVVT